MSCSQSPSPHKTEKERKETMAHKSGNASPEAQPDRHSFPRLARSAVPSEAATRPPSRVTNMAADEAEKGRRRR